MAVIGEFRFMSAHSEPSLYRNGKVLIARDADGNTTAAKGVDIVPHSMPVTDARRSGAMDLERNGFALKPAPLADSGLDFLDHHTVIAEYYPQCAELVAAVTGARTIAFDHNIRSAGGKAAKAKIKGGQDVQEPAHLVHADYTLRSGPERVRQLANPPSGNDTLRGFLPDGCSIVPPSLTEAVQRDGLRFAIINVWRNIDTAPVATHPMAFCDAQTVAPQDLVVFEIHYPDRIGENYFSRHTDALRMHYFPAVTRDETILIKQWDSAGTLARTDGASGDGVGPDAPCTFSFHSAFVPEAPPPDAPDRWSIEVRCMAFFV
jgi:hypothetical protein